VTLLLEEPVSEATCPVSPTNNTKLGAGSKGVPASYWSWTQVFDLNGGTSDYVCITNNDFKTFLSFPFDKIFKSSFEHSMCNNEIFYRICYKVGIGWIVAISTIKESIVNDVIIWRIGCRFDIFGFRYIWIVKGNLNFYVIIVILSCFQRVLYRTGDNDQLSYMETT